MLLSALETGERLDMLIAEHPELIELLADEAVMNYIDAYCSDSDKDIKQFNVSEMQRAIDLKISGDADLAPEATDVTPEVTDVTIPDTQYAWQMGYYLTEDASETDILAYQDKMHRTYTSDMPIIHRELPHLGEVNNYFRSLYASLDESIPSDISLKELQSFCYLNTQLLSTGNNIFLSRYGRSYERYSKPDSLDILADAMPVAVRVALPATFS